MSYAFLSRTIEKVGVVGSGQIGPDIALHFAKVLAASHTPVVVVDISEEALAAGKARLEKKVDRGVKSKAFKPEQADAIKAGVTFTSDYEELRGASLVVEAATESVEVKGKIFEQLEGLCGPETLLLSNSSHLEPEVIFEPIADRSRTAVVHYFFPAERNRALEVVPGEDTSAETRDFLLAFYEAIGKVPLRLRDRPHLRGPPADLGPARRGGRRHQQRDRRGRHPMPRPGRRTIHSAQPDRRQPDHRPRPAVPAR